MTVIFVLLFLVILGNASEGVERFERRQPTQNVLISRLLLGKLRLSPAGDL